MRFSTMVLGVVSVSVAGFSGLAACGSGGGGSGGSGANTTGSTSSSSSSGTASSSSGSSGSLACGSGTAACSPPATCTAADCECIGLVDNTGATKFGLRMSELDITEPKALTGGLVGPLVSAAVLPKNAKCYLGGNGTFSWLLQFDTAASTLKTGGSKIVADPSAGYSFIDEMVQGTQVSPITFDNVKPDASGAFSVTTGKDLVVPIYIDATNVVLLPLVGARFASGTINKSQNCIGHFNAEGLDPANTCQADSKHPPFVTGATLEGMLTLEAADKVTVTSAGISLCFLLAGNDPTYGTTVGGITVCKRTNNVIDFKGNACSTGGTCTDAVALKANFAAASAKINN